MKNYIIYMSLIFFVFSCSKVMEEESNNILPDNNILPKESSNIDIETKLNDTIVENEFINEDYILVDDNKNNNVLENDGNFEIKYDVNYYSQFPLTGAGKYDEPYQNFCEESSLLNAYYYFKGIVPLKEDYIKDLDRLKEIEDKLYGKNGYKDTSLSQSLLAYLLFQNDSYVNDLLDSGNNDEYDEMVEKLIIENAKNGGFFGKVESFSGYLEDNEKLKQDMYSKILESLEAGNFVIVPVYGKGLKNPLFSEGGPVYHNFLITGVRGKGINEGVFIVQEVGISRGKDYEYNKNTVLENVYDFDKALYPDNFTNGEQKLLILFKDNDNLDFNLEDFNIKN